MIHKITIPQEYMASLDPNQNALDAVKAANHIPDSFYFIGLQTDPPADSYIFMFQELPPKEPKEKADNA